MSYHREAMREAVATALAKELPTTTDVRHDEQWYIDQFSIDCIAERFWPLAAQVAVDTVLRYLDQDGVDAQYCDGRHWLSIGELMEDG